MTRYRILVAGEEPQFIRLMQELLAGTGFESIICTSGKDVPATIALEQPDLIILDGTLREPDSKKITRQTREFSEVPIIMISESRNESDILACFEAGIDDYLNRPFRSKELVARMHAVLKRWVRSQAAVKVNKIEWNDLSMDLLSRQVFLAGNEVHLTEKEYDLLYMLATHPNQVMLHEQLLRRVWGPAYRNEMDYLRSYVHTLRKKLEPFPAEPEMILTIQGVGYLLVCRKFDEEWNENEPQTL